MARLPNSYLPLTVEQAANAIIVLINSSTGGTSEQP